MRFINLNGQTYNLDKLVSFRFEPVHLFGDERDGPYRGRWIVIFQDSSPVYVSHSGVHSSGKWFAEWLMKSSFTVPTHSFTVSACDTSEPHYCPDAYYGRE